MRFDVETKETEAGAKEEFSGNPVTDIPTNSTENLNFYAKWTANTYTVTFDANGGSVSQTSAVTVAGKLTSLPTPTYDGYDFLGWYTQKDGGDKVTTDTVFTVDSTIYAHWQNIPVTDVTLDKESLTLQEKGSGTLNATVVPADATNKNVTWESSDTSIATVDANGKVAAISAGTARITVKTDEGDFTDTCEVTVAHGNMVRTPKKVATCTADGNEEYWTCGTCGKIFSDAEGKTEIELSATVIPATGHSYKEPVWNWSEDGKSCTVTFTCANDDSHKETPKVTVSSKIKTPATCTEKGVTEYTATAEFHGKTFTDTKAVADIDLTAHNYKDGKCTVCGAADPAYQKPAKSDTVSGKNDTAKAVQTGDMANPAVWILLLTASALVFAGTVVFRKKKGN